MGEMFKVYTVSSNRTSAFAFLKAILRVKTSIPNDLVYAEYGTCRQTLRKKRLVQTGSRQVACMHVYLGMKVCVYLRVCMLHISQHFIIFS